MADLLLKTANLRPGMNAKNKCAGSVHLFSANILLKTIKLEA